MNLHRTESFLALLFLSMISVTNMRASIFPDETLTFNCIADSYVHSKNATTNYGSDDSLFVCYLDFMDLYAFAFLAFNVSGLPPDAVVTQVKVELSVTSMFPESSLVFSIWETPVFDEYSITWNNMPSLELSDYNLVCSVTLSDTGRWIFPFNDEGYEGQEPHHVRKDGTYYFMIFVSKNSMFINSREASTNIPELIVTYSNDDQLGSLLEILWPIPVAIGLIVVVLIIYIFQQRKGEAVQSTARSRVDQVVIPRFKEDGQPIPNYCINCGNLILEGAKFCIHCGIELPLIQEAPQTLETSRLPLSEGDNLAQKQNELIDLAQQFDSSDPEANKWITWFIKQTARYKTLDLSKDSYQLMLKEFDQFLKKHKLD